MLTRQVSGNRRPPRMQARGASRAARLATALAAAAVVLVGALSGCSSTLCVVDTLSGGALGGSKPAISRAVADDLTRSAQRAMKDKGIAGLSVAVVADDGSSWSAGFGSAGTGRAVTPETPFVIASVTKVFTSMAVMKLVEEGLVDLDKPIGTYVPEMAGRHYPGSRPPTVRELLTHHGGLASDILKGNLYDGPAAGYTTAFMQHIALIAEQPMTEPPRTLYHYSNIAYLLLGALVADVSGESYADFVTRRILEPLGMRDSGFLDPEYSPTLSAGFASAGKQAATLRTSGGPEGGLAASAADLARFLRMILSTAKGGDSSDGSSSRGASAGPVLSTASLKEMISRQNGDVALDFDFEMGLGFNLMSLPGYPDVRIAWKDGGTYPFASMLVVAPDYGVGVAILSNTGETTPGGLAFEAIERVIQERAGATPVKTPGYQFGPMAGRSLEPSELGGVYMSEIGAIVVAGKPEAPEATIPGMKLWMVKREQESYGLQARLLGLIPLPVADLDRLRVVFREIDGRRVLAIYEAGQFRSIALAVAPRPVPAAWQARYGHYDVANPDSDPFLLGADLGFDEKLGFMTIGVTVRAVPNPLVYSAVAIDDTTLVTAGLGRRMGETFRIETYNGREAIVWGGLALQRSPGAAIAQR